VLQVACEPRVSTAQCSGRWDLVRVEMGARGGGWGRDGIRVWVKVKDRVGVRVGVGVRVKVRVEARQELGLATR